MMAYLHCHTKDCGWSQDDFWQLFYIRRWEKRWWKKIALGYSPISRMWNDIKWLAKPRWFGLDKWVIDDITEYTNVKVKVREVKKIRDQRKSQIKNINAPYVYEYTEYQVFSWQWLKVETVKNWRSFRHMKWWTHKSWKKARDTAVCPKCGLRNFDID